MARRTSQRRVHTAARLEDALGRVVGRWLRRRGWSPLVTTSTGYADDDGAHVFARVLLSPSRDRPRRWTNRRPARPRAPRGWRSLVTVPAVGTSVTIQIGSHVHTVTAGRGGYAHVEVPVVLPAGWHDVTVSVPGRDAVAARVRAVNPAARDGVICDIDDTVIITWVPRPWLAAWNTFVLREHARRPVAGMADLLRELRADDGPLVYVSTGAWNFAPHLERFMADHGYPPGPMLLTDWGPTEDGWFRSGAAHKRAMLERLHREYPAVRWTLIGDDGQHDPAIYAHFATSHPDAVRAIAIRQLTLPQRVATIGTADDPATAASPASEPSAFAAPPTVLVTGADGHELLEALAAAGAIPPRSQQGTTPLPDHAAATEAAAP